MKISNLDRRDFLKTCGCLYTSMLLASGFSCQDRRSRKPNIIFILVDDLGWKDVGFMGSRFYETPNIDRLASQGMVFTNAYANAPNCAPTRACLLSGQYSPRHGVYTVASSERGQARFRKLIPIKNTTTLSSDITTIAEAIKISGYVSASIGKWHLGKDPEGGPVSQGFDVNVGGTHAGSPKSYFSPYKNECLADGPEGEFLTDRLTDEAIGFIEQNREKPFFLYLPHYAVHTPIQAKKEIIKKYENKKGDNGQNHPVYAAMIESTDQGVGKIVAKLEELNLTDNTIIFFFSDNGGYGPVTTMKPLRGSKGMLYEGGIRVPMFVKWPGKITPGTRCDTPVIGIDFYPTILQMTGVQKRPDHILDGESLVPILTKQETLKRSLYWHFPAYLQAFKGVQGIWRTTPAGAIRQGDWKLIEFFEDGRLELYNLNQDIGESENLAQKYPDKVKSMHQDLVAWRESIKAPVPTEKNPLYNPE